MNMEETVLVPMKRSQALMLAGACASIRLNYLRDLWKGSVTGEVREKYQADVAELNEAQKALAGVL